MASVNMLIGTELPGVRSSLEPVIAPSPIHCSGVFASRQYETGELIGMYGPDCIATRFDPGTGFQDYAIRLKDNMVVSGFRPDGKLSQHYSVYINHSFNSNVLFGDNRMIEVLKPIEVGEEMLVNYGYAFWRAKLCGANNQVVDALLMQPKIGIRRNTPFVVNGLTNGIRVNVLVRSLSNSIILHMKFQRLKNKNARELWLTQNVSMM